MKKPSYVTDDHITMFLIFVAIISTVLSLSIGGGGWYVVTALMLASGGTLAKRYHNEHNDDGDNEDDDDEDGGAYEWNNEALAILADAFEPQLAVKPVELAEPVKRVTVTPESEPEEAVEETQTNIVDALQEAHEYHRLVTGGSRIGKTTLCRHLIDRRLQEGHRVIVVDPHGFAKDWPNCDFRKAHKDGVAYLVALNEILDIAEERYEDDSIERSPVTLFISEWYGFLKSSKVSKETEKGAVAALQEAIATIGKACVYVICDTHSATREGLGFDAADIRSCFTDCRMSIYRGVRRYEIDDQAYGDCGAFSGFSALKSSTEKFSESSPKSSKSSGRSDVENGKVLIDQDGNKWKVLLLCDDESRKVLTQGQKVLSQGQKVPIQPIIEDRKVLSRSEVETGRLEALTDHEIEIIRDGFIHDLSFSQIVKNLPRPKSEYKETCRLVKAHLANAIGAPS